MSRLQMVEAIQEFRGDMNQRDLSEKLEELANILENESDEVTQIILYVATELRKLSNENYAPGNSLGWEAIQPKPAKKQGGFISKSGKKSPF
jgi:hypothetical protein